MQRKRSIAFFVVGMVLMSLIVGCVSGRAKIRIESAMAISDLAENWKNYDVYYAGSSGRPIGLLFDPKNDGFKLVGDRWTKVEDERTLSSLVGAIQPGTTLNSLITRKNDQVVGYYSRTEYTSTDYYYGGHTYNPLPREINETTIRVDLVRENYPKRNY